MITINAVVSPPTKEDISQYADLRFSCFRFIKAFFNTYLFDEFIHSSSNEFPDKISLGLQQLRRQFLQVKRQQRLTADHLSILQELTDFIPKSTSC